MTREEGRQMAISMCGRCGHRSFELSVQEPLGSKFKYSYLQCSQCGAVVCAVDCINIGDALVIIHEAMKKIATHIGVSVDL